MKHQYVHALKAIPAGAILTMDYEATEDELFQQFQCRCGAPECRGLIRRRSARQGAA